MRGYLLVEEPGPWGPGAVPATRLGEELTERLRQVAAERGVRLLLVRRPSAAGRDPDGPRRLFFADVRRGRSAVLTRTARLEELAAAAADDTGWSRQRDPLLLVCTHGRKDWCCALRGRPVVDALAALVPEQVWECSHLGGDRFAATVLTLPDGAVHGRVQPQDATALVAAVGSGRLLPSLLRGRSCDAMVVQAAEGHVRLLDGLDDLDAVRPRAAVRGEDGRWVVDLQVQGAPVRVHLREGTAPAHRLTCSAASAQRARTWELERVER